MTIGSSTERGRFFTQPGAKAQCGSGFFAHRPATCHAAETLAILSEVDYQAFEEIHVL